MSPEDKLTRISRRPVEREAFEQWVRLGSALSYLTDSVADDELVVYGSVLGSFLHGVFAPTRMLDSPNVDDLLAWNGNPWSSWDIWHSPGSDSAPWIGPPLEHINSETLKQGEQLVFGRSFSGRIGEASYLEVLQKFTHLFGLHYLDEREAFCRIDERGDIEPVIRIIRVPKEPGELAGWVLTAQRAVLDDYMVLTDSALVRMFDFVRTQPEEFHGWTAARERVERAEDGLFYEVSIDVPKGAFLRGVQIIRPREAREAIIRRLTGREKEVRQYASFIAYDWKNRRVAEISCARDALASYFATSDLPYETTPAFFRPEVLAKYKADPEKYRLGDRSLECRDAWYLKTFDINTAGQVHTYLVYLRDLPYEEQLHWKAHNEPPKAPISRRAIETDFKGNWDFTYDPLVSLKEVLRDLNNRRTGWWQPRSDDTLGRLHYSVTSSAEEWANEILHLDQAVVEGLDERWLRRKAEQLKRPVQPEFRSLKLLEECLTGLNWDETRAKAAVAPLRLLHNLRSKQKGHSRGQEAETLRRRAIKEHGSLQNHFRWLTEQCDRALREIATVLPHREE